MFTTPARITDLKSAGEMTTLRDEAAAATVADRIDAAVNAYNHRGAGMHIHHQQDSSALFYLLGEIENHVRSGGNPALLTMVEKALAFAVGRG